MKNKLFLLFSLALAIPFAARSFTMSNVTMTAVTIPGALIVPTACVTILSQPQDVTISNGLTASFSVTAIGTATLSYQWYSTNQAFTDSSNPGVAGSQTDTLWVSNVTLGARSLYCLLSNSCGTMTSSVVILTGTNNSTGWSNVVVPTGWVYTLPFTIERNGNTFRPQNWDVSYLQPAVGNALYVSTTGSDANNGLSSGTPFRSIWKAATNHAVNTIYVSAGYYGYSNNLGHVGFPSWWSNSFALIGTGGYVTNSNDLQLTGWGAGSGYYTNSGVSQALGSVLDALNVDANGDYTRYVATNSIANVAATAGSWYKDGANVLYVHCSDGRAPDSNIRVMGEQNVLYGELTNNVVYLENFLVESGNTNNSSYAVYFRDVTVGSNTAVYMKNCGFKYQWIQKNAMEWDSVGHVIIQGVTNAVSYGNDNFNYSPYGSTASTSTNIEISCCSRNNGIAVSDQNTTTHYGATTVRIMGLYSKSYGQNMGENGPTGSTMDWLLGCTMTGGSNGYDLENQSGGKCWMDTCTITNCTTYSLYLGGGGNTIYTNASCKISGAILNGGTISLY